MEWLEKLAMKALGKLLMKESKDLGKDVHITLPDVVVYVLFIVITLIVLFYLYTKLRPIVYFLWLLLVRRLGPREAWRVVTVTKALTGDK